MISYVSLICRVFIHLFGENIELSLWYAIEYINRSQNLPMNFTTKQYRNLFLLIGVGALAYLFLFDAPRVWLAKFLEQEVFSGASISSFEECAKKYPVTESYPEQCRTKSGTYFTRNIGNELEMQGILMSEHPRPGNTIESPLEIRGIAIDSFFTEDDTISVSIYNRQGIQISEGYAIRIQPDEYPEDDLFPFRGELTFPTQPKDTSGEVVIRSLKDLTLQLVIPIRF